MKPKGLVWYLSVNFGLFAFSSAVLIGLGRGSIQFPLIVGFCVLASIVFTDTLGWFVLGKYLAYIGMVAGASLAVFQYIQAHESSQLVSVANLLIYVQLPLFFQKKSQQVYEQLFVFLLLELVVAALVNDHVLYGVLLLPSLALGCTSLMLFAWYVSSLKSGQKRLENNSRWTGILKWLGRESPSSNLGEQPIIIRMLEASEIPTASAGFGIPAGNDMLLTQQVRSESLGMGWMQHRWRVQSWPFMIALLFFAICHFFFIPRLHSGAYQGGLTRGASVGFSGSITLGQIGELIQNEAPAMRVAFLNRQSGVPFEPTRPPYLRGIVLGKYVTDTDQGRWRPLSGDPIFLQPVDIPAREDISDGFLTNADDLVVEIREEASIGTSMVCIPPMYSVDRTTPFHFLQSSLSLFDSRRPLEVRRNYSFGTLGFYQGQDERFVPDYADLLKNDSRISRTAVTLSPSDRETLTEFDPVRFSHLSAFRDTLLQRTGLTKANIVDQATALELQMATSGELTYTLNLNMKRDWTLDPIEDFILNQKSGHCQYFASALAIMLRSFNIPTRVVVGFRPSEYNRFGHYFLVRQSHAHAWVEAFFTRQQFDESMIELPSRYGRGAWLRLDPTPAGGGSNSGVQLRRSPMLTFDFAQQLWKNYVLDMDRSKQGEALDVFGATSRNAYRSYWNRFDELTRGFRSEPDSDGSTSGAPWFSWKSAGIVILLGSGLLLFWKSFPKVIPKLFRSSSINSNRVLSNADYQVDFFHRSMQAIHKLGWTRLNHQTPSEFLRVVTNEFATRGPVGHTSPNLNLLANAYYRIRYGQRPEVLPLERQEIDEIVSVLERLAGSRSASRK